MPPAARNCRSPRASVQPAEPRPGTLAVRWGRRAARIEYAALLLVAYATCPLLWLSGAAPLGVLLPLLTLPFALTLARRAARELGPALNDLLAATARLELGFALLLGAGWLGAAWLA